MPPVAGIYLLCLALLLFINAAFLFCLIPLFRHICRKRRERSDRQGNVFTIPDESNRENRYNDIFYIEPNSVEAARIRSQLEKDDKDLPSYEEVIRMTSLAQPAAQPASVSAITASNASVNTTDTILTVPPYSEVDPYASTSRFTTETPSVIPGNPTANSAAAPLASVVLPISAPNAATHTSSNV